MNSKKVDQSKLVDAKLALEDFLNQIKEVAPNQDAVTISLLLMKLNPILDKLHEQTILIAEFNRKQHELSGN